ncbi:MAG: hypothetical protein ACLFTB_05800 [Desulfovibrionales bacterium]
MFRKKIKCSGCEYVGAAEMSWPGIFLWVLAVVLFVLSFLFWPLFIIWPILVIFLIVYPIGQVCPECKAEVPHRHS